MSADEGVEERLRFLATILESVRESVIVTDPKGQVLYWNEGATQLFGYEAGEMMGATVAALYPDQDPLKSAADFERLLAGESIDATWKGRRKDGGEVWLDIRTTPMRDGSGAITGFLGVAKDMTSRRRAEEALRRQEARFRQLVERTPDATIVHRLGTIIFLNPAALAMLGHEEADLLGSSIMELIDPDDRAGIVKRAERLRETGETNPPAEVRLRSRGGGVVAVEFSAIPADFDGEPAILCVARDVSAQRAMQARLLVSDRMASIGTLAAGVAHEINNPLTFVLANVSHASELLAQGSIAPAIEALADAREGAERVRRIVGDLKAFSRPDDERLLALDPRPVLRSSIAMARNEIRHRARLEERFEAIPLVLANDARLGQVFVNLLVNAAQAIPAGAADRNTIQVTTRTDAGGRAVVEVRDTGCGISRASLGRVFDPFFTTKPIGDGTGLGLSICHRIVASFGGEIEVESEEGAGTTVRVTLPAAELQAEGAALPAAAEAAAPRRGRVLAIDDEPMIGAVIRRALRGLHETVVTTSGREALDRLLGGENFDVVLCDLMMPQLSGMDVHAELSQRLPAVAARMIFLSGGTFTVAAERFLAEVPNPRLTKPFEMGSLRAAVDEMLARSGSG